MSRNFCLVVVAAAILALGAQGVQAAEVITDPYNGADLYDLTAQAPVNGVPNPNANGPWVDGELTYSTWGENNDGPRGSNLCNAIDATVGTVPPSWGTDKFASRNTVINDTRDMNTTTPGIWFDAHFAQPQVISNFVLKTADRSYHVDGSRQPDRFQLLGSNNGTDWSVIYRYDHDGVVGPWGTTQDNVAVQFTRTEDSFAAGAYTHVRLDLFSAVSSDIIGLVEYQLAGSASAPTLTANPVDGTPIDFGHLAVSTASTTSKITLSNTGDTGSTINVTSGAFGDGSLFSFDPAYSNVTLTAGGAISSMDYFVKFDGSATPGLYTDTLTFLTSAGNLSYAVSATVDPQPPHPGDANSDGTVNFLDYNIVKTNYLSSSVGWAGGDLNGDGTVNFLDYNIVKTHYLHTNAANGTGVQAIPEPATLALLALAGLAIRRKRQG